MYQDEVCDHVLKNLLYAFAYNERANSRIMDSSGPTCNVTIRRPGQTYKAALRDS